MTTPEDLEIQLQLPAAHGLELVAAETAAAIVEHGGGGEATADEVRLALIEGCINAIEHAFVDGQTPEVQVRFKLVMARPETNTPAQLTIWIRDRGHGFDPNTCEEPTLEKKLHSPNKRGWGIKLIRGFMDDLQVRSSASGTVLEMTKFLTS